MVADNQFGHLGPEKLAGGGQKLFDHVGIGRRMLDRFGEAVEKLQPRVTAPGGGQLVIAESEDGGDDAEDADGVGLGPQHHGRAQAERRSAE